MVERRPAKQGRPAQPITPEMSSREISKILNRYLAPQGDVMVTDTAQVVDHKGNIVNIGVMSAEGYRQQATAFINAQRAHGYYGGRAPSPEGSGAKSVFERYGRTAKTPQEPQKSQPAHEIDE